jgi:hypothetical protein
MNNLSSVLSFVTYLFFQVIFIRHWALFDLAFCFVYISFLLFLPFQLNPLIAMLLGFAMGICIDIFYDTLGIHAACCVLVAYLRPRITNLIKPSGGYDVGMKPYLNTMGAQWFIIYTLLITTVHHLPLFVIEAWGANLLSFSLLKALLSIIFTSFVVVMFQYLFYKSS